MIFDALNNIFVKPVSTAYIVQVRTSEREIEKSLSLTWETRQSTLNPQREKFVKKLADFLGDNPEASITILPQFYTLKEKEYIVYYEAKKRFLSQSQNNSGLSLSEADSMAIENMSVKNPLFINYLNAQVPDSTIFTVIEKCERLLDSGVLISRLSTLQLTRKNTFLAYFDNTAVQNRIHFDAAVNTIPYNGYSYYKISYNGEFPGDLVDSYNKMNELNNKKPRKKFNDKRSLNNAK